MNSKTKDSRIAEKEEETKLKAKYPQLQRPGPQFLQKRLQKGVILVHKIDCSLL